MENAADALKIAFAVLVFIIAITIIFVMISKVKSTADVVLYYSDKTNFYEHYEERNKDGKGNRIVTASEIIATLYRYNKETVAITIIMDGQTYYFDVGNEYVVDGETKQTIASIEGKERNRGKFINDKLKNCSYKFIEEFSETPIDGKHLIGSDGSEITLSSNGKKVYVTYTQYE